MLSPNERIKFSLLIENGGDTFSVKFVERIDAHVISKFFDMVIKGTFFYHAYLKYKRFSENFKVGFMNSPSNVVLYNVRVFLSFPT